MLEDVITILIAQLFRMGIEIAGNHRRVERPLVKRQRKIVADYGNLVSFRGFFDQRRGAAAIGTFQVLKYHDGNLCPFWWLENWVDFILGVRVGREQQYDRHKSKVNFIHRYAECDACALW